MVPRLVTGTAYQTSQKISSLSFAGYAKFTSKAITLKAYGFYGGDAYNLTMLGGYAVTSVTDPVKDFVEYSVIKTNSYWVDFTTNGKKLAWGLFGAYSKNLGSPDKIVGATYARGANIDFLYRLSTRLIWNVEKFRLAPEIEYTTAAYAKNGAPDIDDYGKVTDSNAISNFRFLVGFYYFF